MVDIDYLVSFVCLKLNYKTMIKYYPILLSKAGEVKALRNLSQNVKSEIAPILQLLKNDYDRLQKFAIESWSFEDNKIMIDVSLCENLNIVKLTTMFEAMRLGNVNFVPVISSNSSNVYLNYIDNLFLLGDIDRICVRFSETTGFNEIDLRIQRLLDKFNIDINQIILLLDFGLIDGHNYINVSNGIANVLRSVNSLIDYADVIMSTGSFLENLGKLSPTGQIHSLQRFEWNVWQFINSIEELRGAVKYSDYGIKHPIYIEVGFQGSCSIKYTTEKNYEVYRGELSQNHPDGNGQYISFSRQLINEVFYSGIDFSWGDNRINHYGNSTIGDRPGSSTTWVEIGQNHHISLIHSLL